MNTTTTDRKNCRTYTQPAVGNGCQTCGVWFDIHPHHQ